MSKLPQLNLRIPTQHHDLVRQIAHILRESHGDAFAADLDQWLSGRPALIRNYAADPELAARVAELEARLAALQDVVAVALATPTPDPEVVKVRPRTNDPFPDAVLIEADRLNREGVTWEDITRYMKLKQTSNGLRNAVKKWRQRQDQEWAKDQA